ncbi:GmrSD restriction endonuclease domain-containing protein [Mucilaginibacter sp. 22184]|uniref:GmrSD restriction endonuclease domain-containing protein n=1 Tax=Mucilaginibacter sp. 22184 TaxID=3453887 RepID=UPI003F8486FA
MSATLKISTRVRRLSDYIGDIENGLLQVPGFQRDFIWTIADMLELFSSLKMGYPIGTLLLWKPDRSYGENAKVGPYFIPQSPSNFFYILDGFQRINTLFGCLINPDKTSLSYDSSLMKNFRIYYDLKTEEFSLQRGNSLEVHQIPVYKLIDNKETFFWQRSLFDIPQEEAELYLERYEQIGNTLLSFHLPSIDINGGTVDEAIDIFWRLNSKGSQISADWIVSARTYDIHDNFRLGTEIDNLLAELRPFNFGGIKREVILQCIQSSFGQIYFEMKTDDVVNRSDFKSNALKTIQSIKKAVRFLYEELLVVDSKLLPANIQLIFITEFFNRIPEPSNDFKEALKRWFWQTTYSNYFTILSPSKRKEAFEHFLLFIDGINNDPFYNDRPDTPFTVSDFPGKIHFGSVRAKALILLLLNYANGFSAINFETTDSVELLYLFYNVRNEKGDLFPASVIPILEKNQVYYSKSTDLSGLLEFWTDDLSKYFLTEEMANLYLLKDDKRDLKLEIIEERRKLIIEAERNFAMELGLSYDSSQSPSNA